VNGYPVGDAEIGAQHGQKRDLTMSKTAIIVDSACSLPQSICDKYHVSFAPLNYTFDGQESSDPCKESSALALFSSGKFSHKNKVFTTPPSVDTFERCIRDNINNGYEQIIVQTVNRTQGDTYLNATSAIAKVQQSLDSHNNITLRVLDSRTVFAGQGLMAVETIRRLTKGIDYDDVRRQMNVLSEKIQTFILPRSPLAAWERSKERNENNVSWTQALVANTLSIHPIILNSNDSSKRLAKIRKFEKAAEALFNHACGHMNDGGLLSPFITISYGGLLHELKALPGYTKLEHTAATRKIKIIPSVASLAAGIYTSVGSISLALVADEHEWSTH